MKPPLRISLLVVLLTIGSATSSGAQPVVLTPDSLRIGDQVRFVSQDFLPASERRGTVRLVSADSLLVRPTLIRSSGNEAQLWRIRRVALVSLDVSRRREVSSARTVLGAMLGVPLGFFGGWGACFLANQISSSACSIDRNFGKYVALGTFAGVGFGAYRGSRPTDRWDAVSLPRRP